MRRGRGRGRCRIGGYICHFAKDVLAGWANEVEIWTAGRQQETSQTDRTEPRFRGQVRRVLSVKAQMRSVVAAREVSGYASRISTSEQGEWKWHGAQEGKWPSKTSC